MVSQKTESFKGYLEFMEELERSLSCEAFYFCSLKLNRLLRSIYKEIERESLHTHTKRKEKPNEKM